MLKKQDIFLCLIITLLAAIVRIYQYDVVPANNFTFDEYAFTWSGMSLIKDHVPKSWSYLAAYNQDLLEPIEFLGKNNLFLTSPWFDHPPLYSLIVGSASLLGGAKSFLDCTVTVIRIPSLIFGTFSVMLLYLLSRKLYNTEVAVISSLVFATNPSLVFLSRLAVSENFIVLLTLGTLLSFWEYNQTSKLKFLYLSIFLAGLAPLAKVTGIFLGFVLFILLAYQRKWRLSIIAIVCVFLMFSLYFMYGYFYDFDLFLKVLKSHSKRFSSILILRHILFPTSMPFFDPWLITGWIALITSFKSFTKKLANQIVFLPIIIYLFLLLFTGSQSHFYPWYNIMLYPFISIALGVFFQHFIKRPDFLTASLITLVIGTWCINYGFGNPWSNFYLLKMPGFKYIFIFSICLMMLSFFCQLMFKNIKTFWFSQLSSKLILSIFVIANITIIYNLKEILASNITNSF